MVDTLGLVLGVYVCGANTSEKAGTKKLLKQLKSESDSQSLCSRIEKVWVDGGYRGKEIIDWVKQFWNWIWEVTLRIDNQMGFVVIPKRRILKRPFGWMVQARRLTIDYERTTQSSVSMIHLAMIRIVLTDYK